MGAESKVPQHIAIILDGNGRWAKQRRMPRGYGHIIGCQNLEHMCNVIKDKGVKYLTVYAFSTENWKRSRDEVEGLLKLFRQYLKRCMRSAKKNKMKVRIIGDPSAFPQDIQDSIRLLEDCSKDYDQMFFQIAMNYGSRDEILRGVTGMIEDARAGKLPPEGFENGKLKEDPDLLIRTSGEQRLSNFLLWQLAYTEFCFVDVPWPDFHEEELDKAIAQYNSRDRRFGGVKEE